MGVSREGRVVVYSDLYRCTMPQSVQSLCVMMKTSKTKLIPVSVHSNVSCIRLYVHTHLDQLFSQRGFTAWEDFRGHIYILPE